MASKMKERDNSVEREVLMARVHKEMQCILEYVANFHETSVGCKLCLIMALSIAKYNSYWAILLL